MDDNIPMQYEKDWLEPFPKFGNGNPKVENLDKYSKLIDIDMNMCYESYPCKHHVKYIDGDNNECEHLMSGKLIWNLLIKFNFPEDVINNFKELEHFSTYGFPNETFNKKRKEWLDKNSGNVITIDDPNKIYEFKHKNAEITFISKRNHRSMPNRWTYKKYNVKTKNNNDDKDIKIILPDENMFNESSISVQMNDDDILSEIILLDENNKIIENKYIYELEIYINQKLFMSWVGYCMMPDDKFVFNSCIICNKNMTFTVKAKIHYSKQFTNLYFKITSDSYSKQRVETGRRMQYFSLVHEILCSKELNNTDTGEQILDLTKATGYYADIRFYLISKSTGLVDTDIFFDFTTLWSDAENKTVIEDLPISLLYSKDKNIKVIESGMGVDETYSHVGMMLKNKSKLILKHVNKTKLSDEYILEVVGRKNVIHEFIL